jgi:hypothetical protein
MDKGARRTSLQAHSTRALEDSVSAPGSGQSNQLALESQPQSAKDSNGREAK